MFEKFLCPECKGSGGSNNPSPHAVADIECEFCLGTGYATDEDGSDPMYSYDKGY